MLTLQTSDWHDDLYVNSSEKHHYKLSWQKEQSAFHCNEIRVRGAKSLNKVFGSAPRVRWWWLLEGIVKVVGSNDFLLLLLFCLQSRFLDDVVIHFYIVIFTFCLCLFNLILLLSQFDMSLQTYIVNHSTCFALKSPFTFLKNEIIFL